MYCLNQNSREPVTEPDELLPLWKILHTVGADWTYYSDMWGGENYCMFLADDESWEYIVRAQAKHIDDQVCRDDPKPNEQLLLWRRRSFAGRL